MKRKPAKRQLDLFETIERPIQLSPAQKNQLSQLVQMMLMEIAVTLAPREVSNDKNHA